ncbi:hypothetical protein V8D89_006720 [Ganoderma adspersum]
MPGRRDPRALRPQEVLHRALRGLRPVRRVQTLHAPPPERGREEMATCVGALGEILEDVEMDTPGALCSVLSPCDAVIKGWAEQYELWAVCTREMLEREVAGRRRAWKLLPGILGFTAEACGFTTNDGQSEC